MCDRIDEDVLLDNVHTVEGSIDESILDDEDEKRAPSPASSSGGPPAKKVKAAVPPPTRITRRSVRSGRSRESDLHTSTRSASRVQKASKGDSDGDSPPSSDEKRQLSRKRPHGGEQKEKESSSPIAGGADDELNDEEYENENEDGEDTGAGEEGEGVGEGEEGEEGEGYEEDVRKAGDHHEHLLDDSSGRIKIGQEFQADILTGLEGPMPPVEELPDRDQLIWTLPEQQGAISDEKLRFFCEEAMGAHQMSQDRALFILFKSSHDFERASAAVRKRRMVVDEWSEDDRTVFRNSFTHYGKNFRKIRHALPHRSMNSIINHYYSTKKAMNYKELFAGKSELSDSDTDEELDEGEGGACENCGDKEGKLRHVSAGRLCRACRVYHTITRRHRPTADNEYMPPDPSDESVKRELTKCPAEMVEVAADFETFVREIEGDLDLANVKEEGASQGSVCEDSPAVVVRSLDSLATDKNKEVKCDIFKIRSRCLRMQSMLKAQDKQLLSGGVDKFRYLVPKEGQIRDFGDDGDGKGTRRARLGYQWSDKEKVMVFHCLARYGDNFDAISEVVGTKSSDQVKAFYADHKDKFRTYMHQVEKMEEKMAMEMDVDKEVGVEVEVVDLE